MKNPLLQFLNPKKQNPADVSVFISANAADITAARDALPSLRATLDKSSLLGTGDAAALTALNGALFEIERLEHRAGVLARAALEAQEIAEHRRIEGVRARAVAKSASLDAALTRYSTQAKATAATVAELDALAEEIRAINADLSAAGADTVPHAHVEDVTRKAHLPSEIDGEEDYRSRFQTENPWVVELTRQRNAAVAKGERDVTHVKGVAVSLLMEAHARPRA